MYFRHKRKSKKVFCSEPIFLDIETSWNHDSENPITWMVSCNIRFNGYDYQFRKPSDIMRFYLDLYNLYDLHQDKIIVTYIHNESFDLSYLLPFIQEMLPYKDDRFGIYDSEHKIITYQQGCFHFKCTYLLTNMSLERWSESMNVEHKKQVGLYDYSRILYQDSELSENDNLYDSYDVLSMEESFHEQLKLHDDNITTVPLTNTGYIRRKLRKSCNNDHYYRQKYFLDTQLDVESYKFVNYSYSGGYTHNNRWCKDKVINGTIGHRDFRSHYPTQLRVNYLPFGKPQTYYDATSTALRKLHPHITLDDIIGMYPKFSSITKICITRMELKDKSISMPFMQVSKMWKLKDCKYYADNGRLLKLIKGKFITYVDNLTLEILKEQYRISGVILKVIRFPNKKCPECLVSVIDELFKAKSDYKILYRELEETKGKFSEDAINANLNLMLSKALLNSIYGCMATNPVRPEYDIDCDKEDAFRIVKANITDDEISQALKDYYGGINNFLPYQVGCFVTALARYELYQYIKVIGYDKVLYCDTDSIFYLKDKEVEKRIEQLNKEKHKTAPYITDSKGKRIYYDVFESESDCIAFKGLHSKCYGVVIHNPKKDMEELQLTIAGIPARTLIDMKDGKPLYLTREEELSGITKDMKINNPGISIKDPMKSLDKLTEGVIFRVNAGSTCRYITIPIQEIMVNGHKIETAGGAIIKSLNEKIVHDIDCDYTIRYNIRRGNLE